MHFFPDDKIIVSFGSLHFTWYAAFILLGAFIAYALVTRTMKKWGYSPEVVDDYFIPVLFIGILGARLYYVLFEWSYYASHPAEIFAIWNGGLAIHGGLIAGAIFTYFYCKTKKISILRFMDVVLPGVMLAQAFGRWGNFMNQEAFGPVVPESYFDHFPLFIKEKMFVGGAYHEPTFLYESAANLIGFFFIVFIFRKYFYRRHGDCGFMYMVWYGIVRFYIEGLRTDSLMLGPLRIAQCVSLVLIIVGVVGLSHKFAPKTKPVVIFDLDGTLIDSQHLVFETFRQVFKERLPEHELSQEELYSFFGPPLEESFSKYFKQEEIEDVIEHYQRINRKQHDKLIKQMPHAKDMLKALQDQGLSLAVVSNKRKPMVEKGLNTCGLASYFSVVLGKEDLPKPKPDPSGLLEACNLLKKGHDHVIYVGDNAADIKAAKNMAAYSIGYSLDQKQRQSLEKEHPCRLVNDLMEIVDICKEEHSWSDNMIW